MNVVHKLDNRCFCDVNFYRSFSFQLQKAVTKLLQTAEEFLYLKQTILQGQT